MGWVGGLQAGDIGQSFSRSFWLRVICTIRDECTTTSTWP
jgi:hypothetical protein